MFTQTNWKNPTSAAVSFDYFVAPGVSHAIVIQPGDVCSLPSELDAAIRTSWGGGLAPQLVQVSTLAQSIATAPTTSKGRNHD